MTLIVNRAAWLTALMATPFNPIAVKTIPPGREPGPVAPGFKEKQWTGILSHPPLTMNDGIRNDEQFQLRLRATLKGQPDMVRVISHKLDTEPEPFVWTGTLQEFKENWIGD